MRQISILALFLASVIAAPVFGQQNQQKRYDFVRSNDETVRLDPGNYYSGLTYQPGWEVTKIQVEVEGESPITLAIVSAKDWDAASGDPARLESLKPICIQEHVVKAAYTCDLPPREAKRLIVRDERAQFARAGEMISGHDRDGRDREISEGIRMAMAGRPPRQFFAPNNVHIQYLDWTCVENCNLPDPPHDRVFDWLASNTETLRLDPADFYTGSTYNPGPQGGNMHLDIEATRPITIELAPATDWGQVTDSVAHRDIKTIDFICVQQHAVKTTYTCHLPGFWSKVLVIRDERDDDRERDRGDARSGASSIPPATGAALFAHNSASRREFVAPNEVHIQYYSWQCVAYCDQPVFEWARQVQEKYELTNIMKIYGGITADHDGAQVSIKVKSPVPMAVAILPSRTAGQLYGKPEMFESAVENSPCQQRGVQSSTFQCQLNVADGPQSLVLLPEPGATIPKHKKTEVEVQAVKCVENCNKLPGQN